MKQKSVVILFLMFFLFSSNFIFSQSVQYSDTASMLSGYTRVQRFLDSIRNVQNTITSIRSGTFTFTGNKSFSGAITMNNRLTVNGAMGQYPGTFISNAGGNQFGLRIMVGTTNDGYPLSIYNRDGDEEYLRVENPGVLTVNEAIQVGNANSSPDYLARITSSGNIFQPASSYHYYGAVGGVGEYGFRDNGGTMEFKNKNGLWAPFLGSSNKTYVAGRIPFSSALGDLIDSNTLVFNGEKMGIGISNPIPRLHVARGFQISYSNDFLNDKFYISTENRSTSLYSEGDEDGLKIKSVTGNKIILESNVGIGVYDPTEKLSVNGNIRAKKLIISQSGWPDYVFSKNYRLRPIREIDAFIRKNHHLPDMPSAKDIENKGLDVGSGQALLLKKIEEMTLYIIELEKRVANIEGKTKSSKPSLKK